MIIELVKLRQCCVFLFSFFVTCSIPVFAGLDDGLVGWWKLDEGAGTTSDDSSDYNRTLSLQNGTSWTAGQINHGAQLDGVNDELSPPSILVEGNFSVSFWVNPQSSTFLGTESNSVNNSIDPINRTLIKPLHGGSSSFGLGLSVGTNGVSTLLHASSIYCQPLVYTSTISSWVHLALILKNQQPILFVNGALVKTGLVLGRPAKLSVSAGSPIGKGYEEEDRYQGGVDEVRMYDRALSSAEVFHLYAFPFDLNSNSPLTLTENSSAGTIVGEFNATDPNGDNVSYALMPALPSAFSPVLWLDANDSSTVIESSGAVSAWQDKS
ncbi:MAG: LamG domain-containing protein, partial [Opitutales bacterium]|nr:LamG domain-containing protein [Opitutales bacterium]